MTSVLKQVVNPAAYAYEGSNPAPGTRVRIGTASRRHAVPGNFLGSPSVIPTVVKIPLRAQQQGTPQSKKA
jgi:hypothetical protein